MKLAVISEKGKSKIKKTIMKNNDNFDIETFDTFEDFITFSTQRTVHFDRVLVISEGVLEEDTEQLDARFEYFSDYVKEEQKATRVVLFHRQNDRSEVLDCFNKCFDSVIYSPMLVNSLTVQSLMKSVQLDIEEIAKQFGNGVAGRSFETSIDEVQVPEVNNKKKKKGFSLFGGFGKKVNRDVEQSPDNGEQAPKIAENSDNYIENIVENHIDGMSTSEVEYYNEEEMYEDTQEDFDEFTNFKVNMDGLSQNESDNFNVENENSVAEDNTKDSEFSADTTDFNSSANNAEFDISGEFDGEVDNSSENFADFENVNDDIDDTFSCQDLDKESDNEEVTDNFEIENTSSEEENNTNENTNGLDTDTDDNGGNDYENDIEFDIDSAFDSLDVSSESEARSSFSELGELREVVKVGQVEKVVEKVVEVEKLVEVEKEILLNGMTEDEAREVVAQNRNELSNKTEDVLNDILSGEVSEVFVFLGNNEISCKQSLDLAKYVSNACNVLYVDLDTKYHPLLGYIDYIQFKNQNRLRSVDISKIKNVKSLLKYVVSVDGIDYISLDYGQDIQSKDLQSLQRIVSECVLSYSVIIVNLPYNRVDCCKDLINDSIKIICIEQSIASLSNAIISLEKDIRNRDIKMNIIRDVRYLINVKNAEGDLGDIINKTDERLRPTLRQFNWVDIQYTVYYEFDRTTLLELLDLMEG